MIPQLTPYCETMLQLNIDSTISSLFLGQWKRFYVHLAGDTNGTHKEFASCLFRRLRQAEVSSPEESDYVVVFCPFMSQVETDLSEALEDIPGRS